ncbi:MAG: hypothetical protein E6J71_26440, partial [Deltaproteobacteria bacterium]
MKGRRQSAVRWMLAGVAAVLVIGGHARDASAVANVCNAKLDSIFVSGPNFVVPGNATRDKVRLQLTLGAGTITGAPTPPGPRLTLHRLRYDLDCSTGGLPCTDQGAVVSYGGDSAITTDCPGVTWSTNVPGGGSATNEIVFTPSSLIVIPGGVSNFCHLEFDLIVANPEPTSGPQSDATPLVIEEVFGFVQAALVANGDATCNNNLQAGNQGSAAIPQCPVPCTGDQCTDRTCPDDGPNAGTCVAAPKTSTACTDTDGNVCTLAGCEASPTDPTTGVCVQTHMFASDSTPCPDTDGIACTTAGCDGQGVCDQDHIDTCCDLSVDKTACVAPPPGPGCTGGAIALTLKYTGPTISGPTTVTVKGSSGATTTYTLASLNNGDVLTKTSENGFTIDATAHGQSKLGSTTTVTINGTSEVLHTSCSCKATPDTNLALCDPMCLDASSPDNTTGTKGPPSPLWTLVGLKDPTLGTETCGGTTGDCQTALPAGGADVEYTYTITNNAPTTVTGVTVEDDQLGAIPGSPIASIPPGGMATLTAKQFVAATTLNTVTVSGNGGVCTAQASAAVVAPCVLGYPFTSKNPRTSVAFNESEVLRAFQPATVRPHERLKVFYNDEHALTLGVSKVLVKTSSGTTMMTFPFTLLPSSPAGTTNPQVGTTDLDGDKAGTDTNMCTGFPDLCDRPLFPALFITDITDDPSSKAGDWQSGIINPQSGA